MSRQIRVGVLDEQEVVHYGLRAYFSGLLDIAVDEVYFRPDAALRAIGGGRIDVLFIDYVSRCKSKTDFIRSLCANYAELRVLVFLDDFCAATVDGLKDIGVHGIICKRQPLEDCVKAIRLLAAGQNYCCPVIDRIDSSSASFTLADTRDPAAKLLSLPALTLREREVLRLCISGLTVTCIAELSGRSLKTVSTQKQAAYRKLGLRSDLDLFRRLAQYGG